LTTDTVEAIAARLHGISCDALANGYTLDVSTDRYYGTDSFVACRGSVISAYVDRLKDSHIPGMSGYCEDMLLANTPILLQLRA